MSDYKIKGYASVFGNIDDENDVVDREAFRDTKVVGLPILWDHDKSTIIGILRFAETDDYGLLIEGELFPFIGKAGETVQLIGAGIQLGLSIGYRTKKISFTEGNPNIRTIEKVRLSEISVVPFPVNSKCLIQPRDLA